MLHNVNMSYDESSEGRKRVLRKRQVRTQRVLATAMRLVQERGMDGFTLGDLAAELDYSAPALYRYFPSKDALVAELQRSVTNALDRASQLLVERCAEWCDANDVDEDLRTLLPLVGTAVHYDRFAADAPELFGLLSLGLGSPERMLDDDQARSVIESADGIFRRLARQFDAADSAKSLQPGEAMSRAVVLWAALQGVVQLRKIRHLLPDALDSRQLLETVVYGLFEGWGVARASVTRALELGSEFQLFDASVDPGFEVLEPAPALATAVES